MIAEKDYLALDATDQARLVRDGEVTASELLDVAIARAERLNPQLNAIVIAMHDIARKRAAERLEGPFAGVPFLLKDLFQDYAGAPATSGCKVWKRAGYVPKQHSEIVARDLAAGLVIFGRTNTPEFGAKGITEPDSWGPTHNPWNLLHSPGGSSGGSAAAVAAGIVAMAGASDGGGSIRIPSGSSGLFGLKPGRGRTPTGPGVGEAIHGAAMNHVLTRSVRDSATMLDATHGPEAGSLCVLAPPERPYAEEVEREPRRLRVAFSSRSPLDAPVHPDARAAVERTAALLEGMGHAVEPAEPPIDGLALVRDFLHVWYAQLSVQLQRTRELFPGHKNDFELDSLALEAMAQSHGAIGYARSYTRWLEYGYALDRFLADYDVYMTPTLAMPPPRIGEHATPAWAQQVIRYGGPLGLSRLMSLGSRFLEDIVMRNLRGIPFTQLANVTGVPAMSVPLHHFENGLPLGIHFLAGHNQEGLLFSLAGQLERAAPWSQRRPQL